MKQRTLEPGLLQILKVVTVMQLLSIVIMRPRVGAAMGVHLPWDRWLWLALPIPLVVLVLAWIPWFHLRLGRAFLPIVLIINSLDTLADKYLTLSLMVVPAQQELDLLLLIVNVWMIMHIITLLIAWQYPLFWVFLSSFGLNLADGILSLPFIGPESPLYPLFLFLFFARLSIVTVLAIGVHWLIARQREQRAALAEANQKLAQYAATAERLAVSQERIRLAQELHDTLAHSLSSVTVQLEASEAIWKVDIDKARSLVEGALANSRSGTTEARRALQALRAGALEEVGLRVAVGNLAHSAAARANFTLNLKLPDDLPSLTQAEEQCVYRVAQEALANVARHARATHVLVELEHSPGELRLTVADNGKGFDPRTVNGGHFGLKGLRERADLVGAKLDITSEPQHGTTLILHAPITEIP